ncbi:MAG: TonB-dependent receptor [Chitinophagaceae bacterium]
MSLSLNRFLLIVAALLVQQFNAIAQTSQNVRGTLIDLLLQTPIADATITLGNTSVVSDATGNFRFRDIPAGKYTIKISHIGYKEVVMDNVDVSSGKEVVLTVPMEADIKAENAVTITANSKKNRPLNDMSVVSARAFTVEETQRYAASVNDPLRMVTAFAGVNTSFDGNNNIVIRGNAPNGLLWRMEGVDIPNPNHFAPPGSSGGGISILSSQLLSNSDFITGAFAAEYGNALSGVFDLKLRRGNNEKREYTAQAGVLGLNIAAEGPLMKFYKGSYLVNYRYSTLGLLQKMGLDLNGGSTNFQDLSYNIYLPTGSKGSYFTLFGFAGLSDFTKKVDDDTTKWEHDFDRYGAVFKANTGAAGATNLTVLSRNTSLRSSVAYSYTDNTGKQLYREDDKSDMETFREKDKTSKFNIATMLNHKFSARNALRAGANITFIQFDYYRLSRENAASPVLETINTSGNTQTVQLYGQWQYKPTNNLSFNTGLHYLLLTHNHSASVEPRASIKWDINRRNSLAFGYGMHSQVQSMGIYFAKQQVNGHTEYYNNDLGFTKAQHFVLSYNRTLAPHLRFKAEVYYQHLTDVPVENDSSKTFSTVNIEGDFITEKLVNKGTGKNYGIELSLEKYLYNNFYYMVTSSIYQAKYKALDGIERNTRFNGGYTGTFLAGKEFIQPSQKTSFDFNIKVIYAGGYRTTPINVEESRAQGYTVYYEKQAFSLKNPNYFRADIRASIKWNMRKITSTLSLDIQNVTNRKNVYDNYFDPLTSKVYTENQIGILPVVNYKIEF